MQVVAVDIGGSGCRATQVRVESDGAVTVLSSIQHLGDVTSASELASRLRSLFGDVSRLGVSTAGFVDDEGVVSLCRVQPWVDGPLRQRLQEELGGSDVRVVNDGEAHAWAHVHLLGVQAHPSLTFAIGTSVGFGVTDETGQVVRPRSDRNWDIGAMRVSTRASNRELWWCLGSRGLAELEADRGPDQAVEHFGWRIGGMLGDFTTLFQPRSIVLTGGIVHAHADVLLSNASSELSRTLPENMEPPRVMVSPFGQASGVAGAAVHLRFGSR